MDLIRAMERGPVPVASLVRLCESLIIRENELFGINKHLLKLLPPAVVQQLLDAALRMSLSDASSAGSLLLEALVSTGRVASIVCTAPQVDHVLCTLVELLPGCDRVGSGQNTATNLRVLTWRVCRLSVLPPLLSNLRNLEELSLPGKTVNTSQEASLMASVVVGLPQLKKLAVKLSNDDATAHFVNGLSRATDREKLLLDKPVQLKVSALESDWPKWLQLNNLTLRGAMDEVDVLRLKNLSSSPLLTALRVQDTQRNATYVKLFGLLGSQLQSVHIFHVSELKPGAATNNIDLARILTLLPSASRLVFKLDRLCFEPIPEHLEAINFANLIEFEVAGVRGSELVFLEAVLRRSDKLQNLSITGEQQLELVLRVLKADTHACASLTEFSVCDVPEAAAQQIVELAKLLALLPRFTKLRLGGLRPRLVQLIQQEDLFFEEILESRFVSLVGFHRP